MEAGCSVAPAGRLGARARCALACDYGDAGGGGGGGGGGGAQASLLIEAFKALLRAADLRGGGEERSCWRAQRGQAGSRRADSASARASLLLAHRAPRCVPLRLAAWEGGVELTVIGATAVVLLGAVAGGRVEAPIVARAGRAGAMARPRSSAAAGAPRSPAPRSPVSPRGDVGGGVGGWLFADADLDERFAEHERKLRCREYQAVLLQREAELATSTVFGQPVARFKERRRERVKRQAKSTVAGAGDEAWLARPTGKSCSRAGLFIDTADRLLSMAVRAGTPGQPRFTFPWQDPAYVPPIEELAKRTRDRMTAMRIDSMRAKRVPTAADWEVRGGCQPYGPGPCLPPASARPALRPAGAAAAAAAVPLPSSSSAAQAASKNYCVNAASRLAAKIKQARAGREDGAQ
jgi:hypothetical protein